MNKQKPKASIEDYFTNTIEVSYTPSKYGKFEADLYGYIEEPSQFSNIISVLNMMEEGDEFVLNLQSGGGSLDTTDAIIHAMRKCKGHIHVVATGNCSSAATIILLEAHSFELSDGANFLLHCGSLGSGGTYSEFKQSTAFYNKFMEKSLRTAYSGFLTEKEIDDMLNGLDLWLDAQEWLERSEKRNMYYQEQTTKVMEAIDNMQKSQEIELEADYKVPVKKPSRTIKKPT